MAHVYDAVTSSGSTLLPIADATHVITDISAEHPRGQIHVVFYEDDEVTVAEPTAGTITPRGGLIAGQFLEPGVTTSIPANEVGPEASYTPPVINGPVTHLRFELSGITGGDAAFVNIKYWGE